MKSAILVGPYTGNFFWEMFYFAPGVLYNTKNEKNDIIVATRPDRFDLYGKYCCVFIPLTIKDCIENGHCSKTISQEKYESISELIVKKYEKNYTIKKQIYPRFDLFYSLIKWQFSRLNVSYDFLPRTKNKELIQSICSLSNIIIVDLYKTNEDSRDWIITYIKKLDRSNNVVILNATKNEKTEFPNGIFLDEFIKNKQESSLFGLVFYLLDKAKFMIGRVDSPFSNLGLIKRVPLVNINFEIQEDEIKILNPFGTKIVNGGYMK